MATIFFQDDACILGYLPLGRTSALVFLAKRAWRDGLA